MLAAGRDKHLHIDLLRVDALKRNRGHLREHLNHPLTLTE